MADKRNINEYGMQSGPASPVGAQRTGAITSVSPSSKQPASPSAKPSLSPATKTPVSPSTSKAQPKAKMLSLKAQDAPINSVVKNKAGQVVGTVVEPIEKTAGKPRPPRPPVGNKADAVVIKDPRGKYKVVKGKDALIIDDPRVQQESATKTKLALEGIITVNNRSYGNSLRLDNINRLPFEEQLSVMNLVDYDLLNEAWKRTVVTEAFDAPYPVTWEDSDDFDAGPAKVASALLSDGDELNIVFAPTYNDKSTVAVEFYRDTRQEITGEGDAFRILATVISAIRDYVEHEAPAAIVFSAVKEWFTSDENYDDVVKSGTSRVKLYNRLVNSFASKMGYTSNIADKPGKVVYKLVRTAPAKTASITEAFDAPYPFTWDQSQEADYGDQDAIAKLPDGSPLHVMFSYNESDDFTTLEFYRNNSQDVSGEGDAYRIFATVMAAVQQYVKKIKPSAVVFSAVKDTSSDQGASRIKLYNRMVKKYASQMGYEANIYDHGPDSVDYQLIRTAPAEPKKSVTEGAVPENGAVRVINKLMAKPFPANDIKGQMDAFFAIPDPGMIKAFRQVRAEDGDHASLHPVLRKFIKTLHPSVQKSIKLNEAEDIGQVKQAVIQGVKNIDVSAKDADIAKKNAALLDKLYTELNKGSVLDRISGVLPDMLKGEYPERMIADIVQQLASAPLTYQERARFSDNLAKDKVIDTRILLKPGIHTIDELTYNDPINRKVFDHMKTYGLNQQMKGPGEHALAILSKNISLQGKGDISVNGTPVEIKAAVGSSANALGGRFGEAIGLPTREQIISEISKYPAMKQLLDQHLAKQKSLNVIGFTMLANNAGLKPAERAKLAKGIFGAIFGTSASKVISTFNTPQADPEAVRLAYIEDNFDWYKNGKQGGSWEVLAGLNFAGNSVGVLKTGSDIAKVPSVRSTPYIITTGKPQEMLYQFTPKAL